MADEQNFLSNKAVRQISKVISDVRNLTNRVNRLGVSGPRTQGQVFATLGDFVDGSDGYDATQAINGGEGGSDWSSMEDGRSWGDATDNIGLLYAIESDATDYDGTYPVYQFSDGTNLFWGFQPRAGVGADETVSFKHYIDESNNIRFYEGGVWIQEDAAVIVDDGAGFPLLTDQAYWVEVDTAFSSVSVVNSTVQAGTMGQFLTVESGPSLTTKVLLATVEASNVVIAHEGDLHFESLYTPEYGSDFYDSTENEGQYFGLKEHTGTGDDVNFEYFVEGNMFSDMFLAGEMVKHTEEGSNFKFGGVTEEESPEYTSGIDIAIENQITLIRSTLDYKTKAGLTELLESNAAPDVIIKALAKWLGIEPGGVFKHLNSPAITDSGERWKTLVVSKDGGGTHTIYIDNKGHIWKVDEDDQPPPVENWRYEHCSDPSTYPDIILPAEAADDVILKDDQCYKVIGETEAAATGGPADDTYASCAACEGALTNEQWKDCDTDTNQAVLSELHTDVDFAFLCIGAVWVKCYFDANTATVATDPTVLEQCDDPAPAACADLKGWPAADAFDGVGCSSAAVADQDWEFRWTRADTPANISISGNKVVWTSDAGNTNKGRIYSNAGTITSGEIAFNDITVPDDGSTDIYLNWQFTIGATNYRWIFGRESGTRKISILSGNSVTVSPSVSASLRIRHNGSVWVGEYNIGGGWVAHSTFIDGALDFITGTIYTHLTNQTGGTLSASADSFTAESGGSPVYIDIEGEVCT